MSHKNPDSTYPVTDQHVGSLISSSSSDDDVHNILILSMDADASERAILRRHIVDDAISQKTVLHIALHGSTDETITDWYRKQGVYPDRLATISTDDFSRSASPRLVDGLYIRYPYLLGLTRPIQLDELGTSAISLFQRWETTTGPTVIDFNSINCLLDENDHRSVFQFLHLFTNWVAKINATGYYQLNISEVDPADQQLFPELFDVVIAVHDGRGRLMG